jgi:uncharacterized protein (UPF0332 family)
VLNVFSLSASSFATAHVHRFEELFFAVDALELNKGSNSKRFVGLGKVFHFFQSGLSFDLKHFNF